MPLAVILVPFCVLSPGRIQIGHHYGLLLAACAAIGSLIQNRWIKYFVWYVCAWQVYLFISVLNIRSGIAIDGLMTVLTISLCGLLFILSGGIRNPGFWIRIGAIVQMAIAIPQIFGIDIWEPLIAKLTPIGRLDPFTLSGATGLLPAFGTLGIYNALSAYLVISVPFFLGGKWKWFLLPIGFILIFSKTTTAVAALFVGLFVYYRKMKYIWIPVIIAFVFALFENMDNISKLTSLDQAGQILMTGRHAEWAFVIRQSIESWGKIIFGGGPGAIPLTLSFVHSEPLGMFFQYGLIGVILLTCYLVTVDRSDITLYSAFVIALVDSLGFYPMHHPATAIQIIVIMGILDAKKVRMGNWVSSFCNNKRYDNGLNNIFSNARHLQARTVQGHVNPIKYFAAKSN